MDTIHIVNAANAAYVPHTSAMLHSLFSSNPGERIHFHFLHQPDLEPALLERLAALCRTHHAAFSAHAVPRSVLEGLPINPPFTEEAWYRVALCDLLPDLQRVLWLDSDTLVLSPVRELWETPLGDLPLAACRNAVLYSFRDVIENIGADRTLYFNSGVMVMQLDRMRAEGSTALLRAAADKARAWIKFADQDALNMVYHRRYRRLPLAWNVLSQTYINVPEVIRVHGRDQYEEALARPRIVHFTGLKRCKPWFFTCSHPYRASYLEHRGAAGWAPPDYPDRTLRSLIARQLPLRLREIVFSLQNRRYREALSYVRQW